ncbi:MAG TPA: DUF58 domain-containing protein [Aggregatilineales bacterium]|nr:DUF58 domain-containing protein [Aggregatilineales bacterium]
MKLDAERLQRIRRLEIQTRRLVDSYFGGAYHAIFKGKGIEFESVRPYLPGDDIRAIDWNVTARTDEAFVKQFTEERELNLLLILDASPSTSFGTRERHKRDLAVDVGAVLSYSAIRNQDRVGLLVFSHQVDLLIPPMRGRNHGLRLLRELLYLEGAVAAGYTDLVGALQRAGRLLKRRSIVVLLSDFWVPLESLEPDLTRLARRHDVIAIVLRDTLERVWPDVGLIRLKDSETGVTHVVDTASALWRDQVEQDARQFDLHLQALFGRLQIDSLFLTTQSDAVVELTRLFRSRLTRIR